MRTLEQFIVVLWDIAWVNSAVAPLGAPYIPCEHEELSAGDTVQVMLDPDLFRIAQEDHGGWNDRMAEVNINGFLVKVSPHLLHKSKVV